MSKRDELMQEMAILRKQIDEIDNAAKAKENAALLGKSFKYHNSYGDGEKWWFYITVTSVTSDGSLKAFSFQTDCHGKIEIRRDTYFLQHSHIPITRREFMREWKKLQRVIAKISA
jgi:hypothetical protein